MAPHLSLGGARVFLAERYPLFSSEQLTKRRLICPSTCVDSESLFCAPKGEGMGRVDKVDGKVRGG